MTEITFYQVKDPMPATVDRVLAGLLEKVLQEGHRVLVVCPSKQRLERIDEALWAALPESFIPHGNTDDAYTALQPVLLTTTNNNANNANIVVRVSAADLGADISAYARVLDIFEGNENQLKKARERWKMHKNDGADLTYFEHTNTGWQRKA